ncbi:MAG TPA: glycosyltransferase family 4 protein [Kineosporiaceae bacterium]
MSDGPRVAIVVANPGVIDTRVVKCVTTLSEAGYRTRVLCHSPDGREHRFERHGTDFVQVPVPAAAAGRLPPPVARATARAGRVSRRWLDQVLDRILPGPTGSGRGGPVRRGELWVYRTWPALAPWRSVCRTSVAIAPALTAELDAFDPDVVFQHDVHELNVTGSWVAGRRGAGRPVGFLYDAREYVIGQPVPPARQVAAYAAMEREFIGLADRVLTVSEPIADQLVRDHRLARRPDVVVNATWTAGDPHSGAAPGGATARGVTGLPPDVPLLVYAGGLAPARGVHTVVAALPRLPGVHLAVVSRAESSYTRALRRLARARGVESRLHVVPFVEPHQVVAYLADCDLGISPLLHAPNHDWALTNKFFEYLQAGLPVVTSDTLVQRELVLATGVGTVFRAGDAADCARAVRAALDDLPALRTVVRDPLLHERMSWPQAARALLDAVETLSAATHRP